MSDHGVSVCLTFDFDAMSSWITSGKSNNPSMISRGEFAIIGVDRVLALLHRHELAATFFVPGHTILAFPTILERIHAAGHELGHHGWGHEDPADFDRDGERRILELGLAAYHRVLGVRPIGYRSPAWSLSSASLELLQAEGFVYDSSCMGGDFVPYYLRSGDRWSSEDPYVFGETTSLVELPVSWTLDDFPHFELVPGLFSQLSAPEKVLDIWRAEFDYLAVNCPGGMLNLTMHPECIGRGHRMFALESLIDHMRMRGARFETLHDVTARFVDENPLEQWKVANPERTGAHAIQSIEDLSRA
jgi:peptidoglycan/xylan/chitin deacetylase (PgdA/CDA1 family)